MSLYETIFVRRSVRQYDPTPLDADTLADIQRVLDETAPLAGQSARFVLVGGDKINKAAAPHYILASCTPGDAAYANVGFVLQKMDLYLQSIGLGSCWLGMAKPNEPQADYAIMLAFGKTDVPQRGSQTQFKRLPLADISDADNSAAQTARLSPSAMNSQPWFLHFAPGKVTLQYVGRGVMKAILKKKMNKVDIGILTRIVVLALEHEGKTVREIAPIQDGKDFSVDVTYD
ncbi:MAG: hypothetical protein LBN05_03865 [Oscillospiraceae bacterium]|nr:hypothetical protein [Oscillospiraceae bacterium]